MTSSTPRLPEQFGAKAAHVVDDFHVNELCSDMPGSLSPFGPELQFPLPLDKIHYVHPGPEDRPNLADGR